MPPIRGHPKTFFLFDPSDRNDDDDAQRDDIGMPPLIENPFPFTASSTSSDATEYAPNQGSFKYTFEHDLIKHTANANDGLPPLVEWSDRPLSFTFAPPYIPPPAEYFLHPPSDLQDQSDIPPLVEAPAFTDRDGEDDEDEAFNQNFHSFAADIESSILQKRNIEDSTYIPRPPNAFILFRSSFIKGHKDSKGFPGSKSLAKAVSAAWRNLHPEERAEWEEKALVAQSEHRQRYPDWRFNHATGDGKRRTKKVKDGPLSKGPRKGVGGKPKPQTKSGKLAKGKEKVSSGRHASLSTPSSESGQTATVQDTDKSLPTPSEGSPANSSGSPESTKEDEGVQEVLVRAWQKTELLTPENVTVQRQDITLSAYDVVAAESTQSNLVQDNSVTRQELRDPLFTGLPVAITSLHPDDEFSNHWGSDESASPPPTSPLLDSDSVRSSPRSPIGTLFNETYYPMTTDNGPHSTHPAGRLSGIEFAMPAFAATRSVRPAVAVANMYNQSAARLPPPSTASLPSYRGTPLSSNPPSEVEEAQIDFSGSNEGKSPVLKRSSSAPAARDRKKPLFPPLTVMEGSELNTQASRKLLVTKKPSLQPTQPGHREPPISLAGQRRQSISEGGSRLGVLPRAPASPTKRNRTRTQAHNVSPPIRGPRRLFHQARRESFNDHQPALMQNGWPPGSNTDEAFATTGFYNQASQPFHTTETSLNFATSPPYSSCFPRPVASEQGAHSTQSREDGVGWYSSEPLASAGSSPVTPGFTFGHTPSSSFSSLANWDGGGGSTSSQRH